MARRRLYAASEVERLRRPLAAFLNSRFWRMMAPLRAAVGVIRGWRWRKPSHYRVGIAEDGMTIP
jgi:hypothetical protein